MSKLVKGIDELSPIYRCGYQQGREDAIDEFLPIIEKEINWLTQIRQEGGVHMSDIDTVDNTLRYYAKQIKEQKNE